MGATPPVKGPLGFISPAPVYLHLLPPLTTLTLRFCSQEQQFRVQDGINSFNLLSVPREFQRQGAGYIWGMCFPTGLSGDPSLRGIQALAERTTEVSGLEEKGKIFKSL